MRNVVASSVETEIFSLLVNYQKTLPLLVDLTELGHPQPPTPIQTDNSMDSSFFPVPLSNKSWKTIDMRYYWLQDRQAQKIEFSWKPNIQTWKITSLKDIQKHIISRSDLSLFLILMTRPLIWTSQTFLNNMKSPETRPTTIPIQISTGKSTGQPPG